MVAWYMETIYSQWQLDIWRVSCAIIFAQSGLNLPHMIRIEYDAHLIEFFVTSYWH